MNLLLCLVPFEFVTILQDHSSFIGFLQGLERSPELIDEAYLQIIKQMQGKTTTCVRGWELLLLLACASRQDTFSSKFKHVQDLASLLK